MAVLCDSPHCIQTSVFSSLLMFVTTSVRVFPGSNEFECFIDMRAGELTSDQLSVVAQFLIGSPFCWVEGEESPNTQDPGLTN